MVNLVGNAIKFTQEGSITIRVDQPSRTETHLRMIVCVEDTGIGIPPDDVERIFSAFVQQSGQDDRKYGGTGLGLAISKQLVELMGGSLAVESEMGKGTKFLVEFPAVEIVEERVETAMDRGAEIPNTAGLSTYKVLVVEDDDLNRKMLGNYYLRSSGMQVIEAENAV